MKSVITYPGIIILALATPLSNALGQEVYSGRSIAVSQLGTHTITAPLANPGSGSAADLGPLTFNSKPELNVKNAVADSGSTLPAGLALPQPHSRRVSGLGAHTSGFDGLTHLDQLLAGTGDYSNTQLTCEPPDNGLAVGNGYVLQAVNTALAIYDTSCQLLRGPMPFNQFFGLSPEVTIAGGVPSFGAFTTDPKCYYDSASGRWFITIAEVDTDPQTGDFTANTGVLLAVSQTSDPTGLYMGYYVPTTGFLPDQPLIGSDANAFFISVNAFSLTAPGTPFAGTYIFAMQKSALVASTYPTVVAFGPLPLAGDLAYSVQPATAPAGGRRASEHEHADGVEYFLSALDFDGTVDNRIAVWTMTGTRLIDTPTPNLQLQSIVIPSQAYGTPPFVDQKSGPTPLGTLVGGTLEFLDSNDDRMNQVVYSDGLIWGALNTGIQDSQGANRAAIAYFAVKPCWEDRQFKASVANQGYVAVDNNHVIFPAIAMNKHGRGLIAFTLVGQDYFPSVAYVRIDDIFARGPVHIAAWGTAPEDGFTGYSQFGGFGVSRWGDYSAAVADEDGALWFGAEYIPNSSRSLGANWGTYIGKLSP